MTNQGWSLCTKNDPKMTKNSQKQWKGYFSKFQYFICLHHLSQFLPQAIWLSTTWFLGNWESRIPGDFQVFQVFFSQNSRLFFRDNHKFALVFLTTYRKRNEKFCLNNFSRPGEKNSRRISQVFQKAKCNPRRIPGVPGFPGVLRTMN